MAAAACEHKVRGGSALSLALSKACEAAGDGAGTGGQAAAALGKSSLTGSAGSTLASQQVATPSADQLSGMDWPSMSMSPGTTPSATASPDVAQPPALAAAAAAAQQQQQQQQQRPLAHSAATAPQAAAAAQQWRRRLPFLACFGGGMVNRVLGDDAAAPQQQPAVSASEVGIRPCFYWLESPISEEDRMFAEANARWLKSDCQDDAVVIEHFGGQAHQTFAGVFDGHGPYGRNAAKYASTHLPQLLAAKACGGGSGGHGGGSDRKRLRAIRESFLEVNAAMQDSEEAGFDASLSGTTACCCLVVGRKVLVASTGDSRCVVARRGPGGELEAVPLTWDAKPSLPEEQRRIAMAGGVVKQLLDERGQRVGAYRVFSRGDDVLPGLAMSRSLGDLYAHAVGVSAEPVTNTYTLGERDQFLILATDGLWDIMGNDEAADFVERYKASRDMHVSCAEALTLEAQERWKALHDEAIVDDISCVILHTAGLPPPDRDCSVPRPLARAASCNDEANELYMQWRQEKERNPSNHKPKQYFKHLYGEGEEGSSSGGSGGCTLQRAASAAAAAAVAAQAAASSAAQQQQQQRGQAPARPYTPPPPPASPARLDTPKYAYHQGANHSLPGSSSSPLGAGGGSLSALACSPGSRGGAGGSRSGSGLEGVMRMEDVGSQSPISSYGDLTSDQSEPSMRRGSAFASSSLAWGAAEGAPPSPCGPQLGAASSLQRGSTSAQPIPISRKGSIEDGVSQSLPVGMQLRPVHKAYPSSSNMHGSHQRHQQPSLSYSHSYRSHGSLLAGESDTPRSGDSVHLEHKVRGGMSRSLSTHSALVRMASGFPSHPSLPNHPSNASLLTSCRTSADFRSSTPGSPTATDPLLSAPLSPQQSPVVVPLGGGYSRVQMGGSRVVHMLPPLGFASMQHGVPPSLEVRADLVARGSSLSRRATDTAGLAEAMEAIDEAGGRAVPPRSCAAAAAAASASATHGGSPAQT